MMFGAKPCSGWFTATVKRQLIWGVALVHAVMMSLFVYDLSQRQREFLTESQATQATSLAQNLSLISATPLLSSDLSGLQELTLAISRYPGVVHVMVINLEGKILAHGEPQRRGQYAPDLRSFFSATTEQPLLLVRSQVLADVVVPVMVNHDLLGWVRVGVAQSETASKLAAITQSGLLYTALAIGVGVLLAWWLASRMTRRLTRLAEVADAVRAGDVQVRAPDAGRDELSYLARAFNFMLDALAAKSVKEAALQTELQAEKELAQVTLASIGDAVMTTDQFGHITFLNDVAQSLLGWTVQQMLKQPVTQVFQTIDAQTLASLPNPVSMVLEFGVAMASKDHTTLVAHDRKTFPIESLASPIFSPQGQVLGCVLVFRDVSERYLVQDKLQWQAGHDALTGLPNRVLLADRLARALEKSRRDSSMLAVCLLDLDKFKPVNDTYGHAVGDVLLSELTARLNQELRAVDTLSRLGGDEFVILLEDLAENAEMHGLLERILQTLAEPFYIDGHRIVITASLGLTVYPRDDSDADTLMRHADQAMYVAKQTGRNRFHRFDVQKDRQIESNHQTLERVRSAVTLGELRLHYQPKLNLRTSAIQGFEALLRWQHPQDGMIPPLSFLPMVEQSDVIVDIGEWVIEQALTQLAQWAAMGTVWPVSVNIAARHFQCDDFLPRLQAILARHPEVSPALLEFEILESVALGDMTAMNALIANCRTLGIGFSLDDFGTGYSSLSYLKRIPVQTLKIDQSFVRDMLDDHDDLALVESVIKIAKLFRLDVIAEGVETVDQGVLLLRLGCSVAQGYGIARPMPPEQVPQWVADYRPDTLWRAWADLKWDFKDLPLLVAQRDHAEWVQRVIDSLQLPTPAFASGSSDETHVCRFGAWLEGHGKIKYGHLVAFVVMESRHARLHTLGRSLLDAHAQGQSDLVQALCTDLMACNEQLSLLLDDIHRVVWRTLAVANEPDSVTS